MKTIRATVDTDGRVELVFGYDRELVDLVKEVSGFRWDKAAHKWRGPYHALAALEYAGRKRGDVLVVVSWPPIAAPPIVMEGPNVQLKEYQRWAAGVLSSRREFLLCWDPRVGKTTVVVHAGATAIATRVVDRVLVIPPANVVSEWQRQLAQAFPGMTFSTLWGTSVDTEKRAQKRAEGAEAAVEKAKAKVVATAQKKFIKVWTKTHGAPPTPEQIAAAMPDANAVAERERAVREKRENMLAESRISEREMFAQCVSTHFVACQHDLVAPRAQMLEAIAAQGPFALCVDECQMFVNEKSPRALALAALVRHPNCRKVWLTSGTPLRNRPEDLVVFYELVGGLGGDKAYGGKWNFLKRYANAHVGDKGFWETQGDSNLDELSARLGSVSHRLTRQDVRPDLPSIARSISLVPMSREEGLRYKALEAALGKKALSGKGTDADAALKTLVTSVAAIKWRAALERVVAHASSGVKTLVGAAYHESLQSFEQAVTAAFPDAPVYVAGGWHGPEKRAEIVDAWRRDTRAAVLLVNILSSGVGIDLSDADGTIVIEMTHVPSDMIQFESRIVDLHLGKRSTRPWVEYLLAAGTVDEDMALTTLKKLGVVDAVVGSSPDSRALAETIRNSGVVSQVDLGLTDKSDTAVEAALDGLRRRLAGEAQPENGSASPLSTAALVGAVTDAFEDEEDNSQDQEEQAYERSIG